MTLNCSGCKNFNLTKDDFYWSKKEPNVKTQKQCKKCIWKKRHPKEEAKIFNIDLEWERHYAY
jgi:hypothetical protein